MARDQFWPFAKRMLRYRALVSAALVFAALSAGGLGAGLLGIKPILDNILGQKPTDLPKLAEELNAKLDGLASWLPKVPESWIAALPTGTYPAVLWIVIGLGILTCFGAICNFLHAYFSLTVISRTIANIRRECFHQVVHLPLRSVLTAGPSDLVSRIVYDTATLAGGLNALLSKALAQITKGLAAIIAAFWLDARLTGIALVVAPLIAIVLRKLGKRIRRASKRALESQAGLYQAATEVLGGLRVVKVHANERGEEARFHRINREVVAQEFKVRTARALASPLVEMLAIIFLGTLALIAVKAILDGHVDKTRFLLVLGALGMAAAQIKPLTGFLNDMQQASAAAGRLLQLLAMPTEPGHDARLPKLPRHESSIAFDNVSFTYPGAVAPAVAGVSLSIKRGQTVAFVGPNGCGKTTLLSLIPRLFEPDSGSITIDGHDIRAFSIRSVRRQIGVVTQDTVLFRGTIRDNIAYAADGVTDAQIHAAARAARAEEFILDKPGGYDFKLAEGGSGLSGGQRQRLAIARAILRDPALLILDEATSMIDAESESKITEAITEFVKDGGVGGGSAGRTCLIVAHRLSTVVAADRIVVLDAGRIVDEGTHAQLLARCDIYQSLARNQFLPPLTPLTPRP